MISLEERIVFFDEDNQIRFDQNFVREVVSTVVESKSLVVEALEVTLTNDSEVKKLNDRWLSHNYNTDILTFDYSQNKNLNAELVLSYETIGENHRAGNGVSLAEEQCRVVFHGVLHCLGYNDSTEDERLVMRRMEDKLLGLYDQVSRETIQK